MQDTPQFFVTQLRDTPKKEVLSALRVRLGALPVKWLQEFINLNGVPLLLSVLDRIEMYVFLSFFSFFFPPNILQEILKTEN